MIHKSARGMNRRAAGLVAAGAGLVLAGFAVSFAADRPPASAASEGCLDCHQGIEPMHASPMVRLGCTDCHGGDASVRAPRGSSQGTSAAERARRAAHVLPRRPDIFNTSANAVRSYTALNEESPEFIRFFNPGDLRVAAVSCGAAGCHGEIVSRVATSMMAHGAPRIAAR